MKFSIPGLVGLLILLTFQPGAADAPPRRTPEPTAADKEIELLPEVVVSASRVPLAARAVGSAVTVITAEEIERKQVRVVSDLLREVPGIAVNRSGPVGAVTQVRIRGTEANHTLVIIDGVEINDPSTGSEFYFDDLLAADIERIEVLRGPQSALYGSDAIGGVINITTKKGRGPVTGSFRLEGGSFGTGNVSAGIRGGSDRYHFSFAGTGFTTSGISARPEPGTNMEKDGHRNQTYDAKLGVALLEDLDIELFGRHVRSRADFDPGDQETKATHWTGRTRLKYSLFDGAWEHIVGAGINRKERENFEEGNRGDRYDGRNTRFDYQTNVFFETSALAEATHSVTFLAEGEKDSMKIRAPWWSNPDPHVTNHGYTGEYQFGVWDRLFLSGSVRRDDNNYFRNATTFRVTAAYLLDETGTRLHGSYGTGVKNPTLFELFGSSPSFVPNPELEPEKSKGWDLGVDQKLLDDRLSMDATYFNNRTTDLIDGYVSIPNTDDRTSGNLNGISKIQGLELTVKARLTEGLTFTGQYTYTDAKDANGITLPRRAKHLASANVAYNFLDGRADLDLGIDYNGEQKDRQFLGAPSYGSRVVTLDEFVLVNVAASYKMTEETALLGRIENLLDESYQEVFGFRNAGIGVFVGVRGSFELF